MRAHNGDASARVLQFRSDHMGPSRELAKPAILIVDDDDLHRVMMRRWLQRSGFDVIEARNGEHAYEHLIRHAHTLPALVIVDGQMPVMDGWQLVLRMQDDPQLASLPVIMVSGVGSGSRTGLREFFQKPFEPSSLMAAVRRHTGSGMSAAQTH